MLSVDLPHVKFLEVKCRLSSQSLMNWLEIVSKNLYLFLLVIQFRKLSIGQFFECTSKIL